jgi:hypothetical protein
MRFSRQFLVMVTLVTSACSYTFSVGPHERSLGGTPATCTTSRAPAIADTVIAVAAGVAAAAAIYACHQSSAQDDDQDCIRAMLMAPPAAATALVLGLSARRGFTDSAGCEAEHAQASAMLP